MQWNAQFTWDGLIGKVSVECVSNEDPEGYGCLFPEDARGFPVCTATVEYPRRGYRAMFGWVQLVRSTDNTSGGEQFEVDPFVLFGDSGSPYCWYGPEPTLFDAPSRLGPLPTAWLAHSFLATTPLGELLDGPRRVVPLLGFSWGFDVRAEAIGLREIGPLAANDWTDDLPVLRTAYPSPLWTFAENAAF